MNKTGKSMTSEKETIIFIHGAWHGAWCWEKYFVPYFTKEGYHCHTFNLPKHDTPGTTKGINFLSINDYVKTLKKEVQKFDTPPILVGHSMGGLVVQKYLETAACKMAILLAPAPPTGVFRTTLNFLKLSYAYPSLLLFDLYKLVNTPAKAKFAFFSDSLPQAELEEYTNQLCAESYLAFLNMLVPNVKVNFHTKIPMLVIGAEFDNIFTIKEIQMTAKKYSADLEIVKDIAHDVMLDTGWEKVAQIMDDWMLRREK